MREQVHQDHEVSNNKNAVDGPLVDLDASYQPQEDGEDGEQLEQEDRYDMILARAFCCRRT